MAAPSSLDERKYKCYKADKKGKACLLFPIFLFTKQLLSSSRTAVGTYYRDFGL